VFCYLFAVCVAVCGAVCVAVCGAVYVAVCVVAGVAVCAVACVAVCVAVQRMLQHTLQDNATHYNALQHTSTC